MNFVYREDERAVMVYGFMKKEQENLSAEELKSFKTLSKDILGLSDEELSKAIEKNVFTEIGEKDA
ncbi:type II toxin-antitoxin system RelE/ParE family toxin [Sulfurovum sp. NBC37-1]|uniref:type II toxin-antitoxin system RelE/ParE family toxin n=1 Tax=Sulfurovum sp. (strain NBC37-1) TaxID=387093 RepID=UPI00210103D8|nr:type II toxin-antitoxin system RelE/ParE family toxin [Sulfurovum sp. NBC37-1]